MKLTVPRSFTGTLEDGTRVEIPMRLAENSSSSDVIPDEYMQSIIEDMSYIAQALKEHYATFQINYADHFRFLEENFDALEDRQVPLPWWAVLAHIVWVFQELDNIIEDWCLSKDDSVNVTIFKCVQRLRHATRSREVKECIFDGILNTLDIDDEYAGAGAAERKAFIEMMIPIVDSAVGYAIDEMVKRADKPICLPCDVSAIAFPRGDNAFTDLLYGKTEAPVFVHVGDARDKTTSRLSEPLVFPSWASLILAEVNRPDNAVLRLADIVGSPVPDTDAEVLLTRTIVRMDDFVDNNRRNFRAGITIDIPEDNLRLFAGTDVHGTWGIARGPFFDADQHLNKDALAKPDAPEAKRDMELKRLSQILSISVFLDIVEMNLLNAQIIAVDNVTMDAALMHENMRGSCMPRRGIECDTAVETNWFIAKADHEIDAIITDFDAAGKLGINTEPVNVGRDDILAIWDRKFYNLVSAREVLRYRRIPLNHAYQWPDSSCNSLLGIDDDDIAAVTREISKRSRVTDVTGKNLKRIIYQHKARDMAKATLRDLTRAIVLADGCEGIKTWYKQTIEHIFEKGALDKILARVWKAYRKGDEIPYRGFYAVKATNPARKSLIERNLAGVGKPTYYIGFNPDDIETVRELFDAVPLPVEVTNCLAGWTNNIPQTYFYDEWRNPLDNLQNPLSPSSCYSANDMGVDPVYIQKGYFQPINALDFRIGVTVKAMQNLNSGGI